MGITSRITAFLSGASGLLFVGVLASQSTACAPIINRDPNLRWWAFKTYGMDRICPEILKTSVPLKIQGERSPVIGRYFPSSCTTSLNEMDRSIIVNVSGSGYAYLPTTKRFGFNLTAAPEYKFDFYMHEDGNWVWGKMFRVAGGPDFQMRNTDTKLLDIASIMTPAGPATNFIGSQVVGGFMAKGFTVVETGDGKEFSLGILPPGRRPFKPIQVDGDEEFTFANETTEIRSGQQDWLGPFEVVDTDQLIQLQGTLQGQTSGVDLIVVTKQVGDIWRESYQAGNGATNPPGMPIMTSTIPPGPFVRKFALRPGLYYVVVDNSTGTGRMGPPLSLPNPVFDASVQLSYVATLIED